MSGHKRPARTLDNSDYILGRRWSWVHCVCAFIIFGTFALLKIDPGLDGLSAHLTKTLVVAVMCGVIAGRFGDSAWHGIVGVFRWL